MIYLIYAKPIILSIYRVYTKSRYYSADVNFGIIFLITFHASAKSDAHTQQTGYGH